MHKPWHGTDVMIGEEKLITYNKSLILSFTFIHYSHYEAVNMRVFTHNRHRVTPKMSIKHCDLNQTSR